jgi:hypothetical protein
MRSAFLGMLTVCLAGSGCGSQHLDVDVDLLRPGAPRGYVLFYPESDEPLVLVVSGQFQGKSRECGKLDQDAKAVRLRVACEPGDQTFEVALPPPPPYFGETDPASITVKVREGVTIPVKVSQPFVGTYQTFGDSLFNFFGARSEHTRYRVELEPKPPLPTTQPIRELK